MKSMSLNSYNKLDNRSVRARPSLRRRARCLASTKKRPNDGTKRCRNEPPSFPPLRTKAWRRDRSAPAANPDAGAEAASQTKSMHRRAHEPSASAPGSREQRTQARERDKAAQGGVRSVNTQPREAPRTRFEIEPRAIAAARAHRRPAPCPARNPTTRPPLGGSRVGGGSSSRKTEEEASVHSQMPTRRRPTDVRASGIPTPADRRTDRQTPTPMGETRPPRPPPLDTPPKAPGFIEFCPEKHNPVLCSNMRIFAQSSPPLEEPPASGSLSSTQRAE